MRSMYSYLRSFHLRNLSLYHSCNAWSIIHRGYPVADFEFYSSGGWIGFKDLCYDHILRPKPRLKYHPIKHFSNCVQLSINFDI